MARRLAGAGPRDATGEPLTGVVRAAGGVVARRVGATVEVLLVHRPAYGDWTFPKGKAERGESDEACALREVEEETGLQCRRLRELPSTAYTDARGRAKTVRYWLMEVTAGSLTFAHEVDTGRWLPGSDAAGLLSYERDLEVLEHALSR